MSVEPETLEAICNEIRRIDDLLHTAQDQEGDAAFWARLQWDGEIIGLRKALCALFGWPLEEAAKEGKADQYVEEWFADDPSAGPVRPDEEPTT
jgi:PAS domain-containing protein